MPKKLATEQHVWVGAAYVSLTGAQAKWAVLRHSVRIPERFKVDVAEVFCLECRRPYDDVFDEPCIAATTNEHLRGGPIGERKKRAHHKHNCELLGCDVPEPGDTGPPAAATG